ncbi:MAG: ABC transporter ATP-binding protein [Opitutales bacterium]|nr:ABC transporter ATP-binding protein [Opitutales bacterium]MCH8540720.1 ABC transporter ATP-binding protein [Opitutales bacterium]
MLLQVTNLQHLYPVPRGRPQTVLDLPDWSLDEGQQIALTGASGSGKTTLLYILGGLLPPTQGDVHFSGKPLYQLSEARRDRWRARTVGFIFQDFHLLERYTVRENILLGQLFGGSAKRSRIDELLERLDLGEQQDYFPRHLSAGQKQRVAIARALVNQPSLILADEPTGNLDPERARSTTELLLQQAERQGCAVIMASHDPGLCRLFPDNFHLSPTPPKQSLSSS